MLEKQVILYELWRVYQIAQRQMDDADDSCKVAALARALRMLRGPIDNFFTCMFVNVEDDVVREARLALLQRIVALPDGIADLSLLRGF